MTRPLPRPRRRTRSRSLLMMGATTSAAACCCSLALVMGVGEASAASSSSFVPVPPLVARATRTSSFSPSFGPARVASEGRRVTGSLHNININGSGENSRSSLRAKPKITVVDGLQDLLDFLSEDDRLCIVKFHASWCKSCQAFGLKYKKLAMEEGDRLDKKGDVVEKGNVRFAEVEFTANAKLCRTLGVKRLPYIHMYRGADGRLCEFACGPKKFQTVVDKMNEYLGMGKEEIEFNRVMNAGDKLGDDILLQLRKETYERAIRYANADDLKDQEGERRGKDGERRGKQAEL